jgi:methionyl-tRNA synthetase
VAENTFYVTTPIYYVNDTPHIGHAYTTVASDVLARYKRLKGYEVLFLTGTDEHGQKVENAATNAGLKPIELADKFVVRFNDLWRRLNISNDDFIRTTEKRHRSAVICLWDEVNKRGDIYLGEYEDWYCTPCETFLTGSQLAAGKCPDCGRDVERLKEASYFFRLSKYQGPLLKHIEDNPDFIEPETKRNEIVSFIKEGLRDLSISRTTFSWGIPVPDDPSHVMYVWFDALTNYLTAAGYPDSEWDGGFWPADVHIIGKDILRFHAIYWPAFLMSAGLPLPKKVFAHGWWTVEGSKMSKSLGNVVDPFQVVADFGVDQFRYFLLREVPFGLDGDFSTKALKGRINGDLANDFGNLLSRTLTMIEKYREGLVPEPAEAKDRAELEGKLKNSFAELQGRFSESMNGLNFYQALADTWSVIREMNGCVEKAAPWKEKDPEVLSNVLYTLAEGLRIVAHYIYPFMPEAAEKIWGQLGIAEKIEGKDFDSDVNWGGLSPGLKVAKGAPLFPRVS